MLQNIAHALAANHPGSRPIVPLIDELSGRVTEMTQSAGGWSAGRPDLRRTGHLPTPAAEMVIEKAKRLVEHKRDVVILPDPDQRLARAYNTVQPASGNGPDWRRRC